MPDFDVDFCMDRRDEVDDLFAAIMVGIMWRRLLLRFDGAKRLFAMSVECLGFGYGFVDRLAKLIPFEIGMTLTKALKRQP